MQTQKSEAEVLNEVLESSSPSIYRMLSERGRAIFFPSKGLIRQSQEAQGKKYNATLGLANEDDGTPMRLPSIAHWINMDPSLTFPYASSYGDNELRRTWRSMIFQKNPSLKAAISTPVVTCGITHGLSMAGYLFTRDQDEILITDLYWGNYRLIFENAYGARLRPFPTFEGKGFGLKGLESALGGQSGKIILLLNFPNNPTGYTLTDREAVSIVEIIGRAADKGKDILVILDDSYFGLVYESGIYKESLFSKLAGLHERILTVKIDGATKEDYVWGFRIGFITYGSKALDEKAFQVLEAKTAGAVRGSISNSSRLSQSLLLKAASSPSYWEEKASKQELLKGRYMKVRQTLDREEKRYSAFFEPLPFNSGYFICLDLKQGLAAEPVRLILLEKYSTGVIALGKRIRVTFSTIAEKDIPTVFENIYQACREAAGR